jgi:hypothetical protein
MTLVPSAQRSRLEPARGSANTIGIRDFAITNVCATGTDIQGALRAATGTWWAAAKT